MKINETLKFSWGHIIAFIALIFISYVSFMGITYLTDGDFMRAGIGVVLIDFFLVTFFIGAQLYKGTDEKFKRSIIFERILFFAAPFAFCILMIPYAHFWTVFERRAKIEDTFSSSLSETKGMFDSYLDYADNRIREYDLKLARDRVQQISRDNKVNALKLQLEADNFINLKDASCQWVDRAAKATVWNVFMLGNIHKIKLALEDWNRSLTIMSRKTMSDEAEDVAPFTSEDPSVVKANNTLSTLNEHYSVMQKPTGISILTSFFLMLMLYCPYIIQSRNTKSTYRVIGSEEAHSKHISRKTKKRVIIEQIDESPQEESPQGFSDTGDYDSFSM